MRAWIFVLAVLATFQAIVQVASTDSILMSPSSAAAAAAGSTKSKQHHRHRTPSSWSSPTLSFAAIIAAPDSSAGDRQHATEKFSLTNLDNIVLNSDNVQHPSSSSSAEKMLIVPTNSSSTETAAVSSNQSASSVVVNTKSSSKSNNSSGNSNLINSNQVTSSSSSSTEEEKASSISRRRHRRRRPGKSAKGHRRRASSSSASVEENSVQDVRINSNELNAGEDVEDEEQDEEVVKEQESVERHKPDPETLVAIEKNLLSLFGFKKRPTIDRSKVVIPEAMKRLYAEATGLELDLTNLPKPAIRGHHAANTVRSFTHEDSKIDHRFLHHHRFRLHFNTSNIPSEEHLKAAELVLSRDAVPDADRVRHRVQVYDIVRPGIKGKRDPIFLLIDTKIVKVNSTENLILDAMPAMERWQREPKHNHGLLIHVSTVGRRKKSSQSSSSSSSEGSREEESVVDGPVHHHVRLRRSAMEPEQEWVHKQPLLFAYTDDKRHRSTRAVRDGQGGGGGGGGGHHSGGGRMRKGQKKKARGICQRHALWVDFQDVGWSDWIVAPRGYDAFYCKGECRIPMADHLNATNHAVVQTLVNSINGQLAPRACCVPTQLTTISLLYLDDQNKVVLKKYQDMAVVGCGCR